jgi:hypothetical protein
MLHKKREDMQDGTSVELMRIFLWNFCQSLNAAWTAVWIF